MRRSGRLELVPSPPSSRSVSPAPVAQAVAAPAAAPLPDTEFVESDRSRDPFRSFSSLFTPVETPLPDQLRPILPQLAVDELKLVAIVLSGDYPRAMVLDPSGKGWLVKKGDYIGRPERVHLGGSNGTDYLMNWRVDRVRDGEVVLARGGPRVDRADRDPHPRAARDDRPGPRARAAAVEGPGAVPSDRSLA